MSYLPSLALVAAGLILLVLLLLRVRKVLRAFRQTASMVATNTQDRTGLIRARYAGLQVAFAQRRRNRADGENQ